MNRIARDFPPNSEAGFISLIQSSQSLDHLKQIHALVLRLHLFFSSIPISTQLLSSSSRLHSIPFSLSLFRLSPSPSPSLFNALIRALSYHSLPFLALSHFALMFNSSLRPGRLAFPFALKSAAALAHPALAFSLHAASSKVSLDLDSFVRTSLADMYVKLGSLDCALKVFDETPGWHLAGNVLLWNVVLHGLCRDGHVERARELFDAMPERSVASWNSLVHGLLKRGDPDGAVELFEGMPEKNVVSWTTMVAGLSQNGDNQRALWVFDRMLENGVRGNEFTLAAALSACARMGALERGVRVHEYALANGFRENGAVGTALVDMYSKCGKIECASEVFDRMEQRDVLTWTAMIMGWAIHGHWRKAFQCFEDMKCVCVKPDDGVFLAVLMACVHSGKVVKGLELFDSMRFDYQIEPTMKHYTCIVDLFGRAGRLKEALEFMKAMPVEPDFVLWGALFSACRAHKNIEMAELAAENLLRLKPSHSGGYVFLSNMYSSARRWDDAEKVRTTMKDQSVGKSPGWSYIEVRGQTHCFYAGDRSHPQSNEIHNRLEELVLRAKEQGYEPDTECVLHDIEDEDKEDSIECHSEKLALAFGLISTADEEEIRIVKNLRVCGDCHLLMKVASLICGREIILRDNKRFHHFNSGVCSCGDYW
ncbi:putative tetratricopeptide-like helical domain superfamily, DYW domain-containing protein [Dioscorea sansibarensis]